MAVAQSWEDLVAGGTWREDFAHRVAVFTVTVPPLRARRGDVEALAKHFLRGASRNGGPDKGLSREALEVCGGYAWPGNVRQLRSTLQRLAATAQVPRLRRRMS